MVTYEWFLDGELAGSESVVSEYDRVTEVEPACRINGHAVSVIVRFDPPLVSPRGE